MPEYSSMDASFRTLLNVKSPYPAPFGSLLAILPSLEPAAMVENLKLVAFWLSKTEIIYQNQLLLIERKSCAFCRFLFIVMFPLPCCEDSLN
jgi:hypothetical protein